MSTEMVDDVVLEVPPVIAMEVENADTDQWQNGQDSTPAINQSERPNQFAHPATTDEINSLAAERQSRLTITQTHWHWLTGNAVNIGAT